MASIADIEQELTAALKAKQEVAVRTLRMLLARLKNERIAAGGDLTEEAVVKAIASEVKRRREAATAFSDAGRAELASGEEAEIGVLEKYLPAQASEADIAAAIAELDAAHAWTQKDFGQAMKQLKEKFGSGADGAVISKVLKDYLA
jgi:uncharacterized protein YqeY